MEDTRIDIAATAENLKEIRQFVRDYIDKCGGLDKYKDELVLAIDEACQNVVRQLCKAIDDSIKKRQNPVTKLDKLVYSLKNKIL